MGSLDGRDSRLPGLDTLDEVLLVIVRAVELNFVLIRGNLAEPIDVGSIESSAVNPNPAVGPNPLGAAADIVVSARDNHGDIVWILAGDPVFGGSVPNCIFGRELADAFDFQRPVL